MSRLVNLLDRPEDIPVLAPLVKREILYRLLQGEQGDNCGRSRCPAAICHRSAGSWHGSASITRSPLMWTALRGGRA
ncbi:AraC family transcriptional regulator [Komagataeibacter rhaeticus]|nr:AraC family transcriptional regulator [Komagataeibacter rhaeticus]